MVGATRLSELPPLALYLHFPWCVRKCPYCDFNSHPMPGKLPEEAYIQAFLADLESALPYLSGRKPISLFLGGGTPSLFSPAAIGRLLEAIYARLPWQEGAEITMEANPGTLAAANFAALRSVGINRLSLGIQSFNAAHLKILERIHTPEEACRAAELASRHFERFNLDLMYGLPGQTLELALADLETALSFAPPHLSCYQLTLEPETRFGACTPQGMPEDDLSADMQEAIESRLDKVGFEHYETSAFARPGQHCQHNLNYWQFGDYLGIGAGAHSKLSLEGRIFRQARWTQPEDYLQKAVIGQAIQEEIEVGKAELPLEFMMNALRLNQGFPRGLFAARTGLPLAVVEPALQQAVSEGWLVMNDQHIEPTRRGRRFLNHVLERWLPNVAEMTD